MTLLQPAALAFAALAPVIILLYLLKRRRRLEQVSTLMFWQRVTATDHRGRAWFQRLRQAGSLLLHLLLLALLLLALARPEFRSFRGAGEGAATVVVLDCRARMQALGGGGGGSRFDAARQIAGGYLRRASPGEPVALLAAGFAPRVAVGFSGDEKPLLDGLAALSAGDSGGRIEDAIRAATDLLAAHPAGGRIVLITDPATALPPGPANLERRVAGDLAPLENTGINRLTARPLPNSPETDEVFVEIENFGPSRQTGSIEISSDGALIDVKPFDLAPGERRPQIYSALAAGAGLANARGWLTAHLALARPDAFPLDDDAWAVIPPPRPLRVLLVTRGNLYLESLLKADPTLRYDLLAPEAFAAPQAAAFDAVVLDDFLPPGFERLETLPAGNYLFARRSPFDAPAPALDRPAVTDLEAAHPVLRLVDLRDILFLRAAALALPTEPAGDWRLAAIARALDQPLIVTGERPGQRLVAFAFGAADSELPLRVAFPLLVHNTLDWLGGRSDAAAPGAGLRAGEPTPLPAGGAVGREPQRVYAPGAKIAWQPGPGWWVPARNGFYRLRAAAGGAGSWAAVNTGDREMSALNATPSETRSASPWFAPALRLPAWPPWVGLALAGYALCLAEWWSFHRRHTE